MKHTLLRQHRATAPLMTYSECTFVSFPTTNATNETSNRKKRLEESLNAWTTDDKDGGAGASLPVGVHGSVDWRLLRVYDITMCKGAFVRC